MNKEILLLTILLTSYQAHSVESIEQSFGDVKGNIQQTMGENSDINNNETRNLNKSNTENTNTNSNSNSNSITINIQTTAREIVDNLPESKKKVATEVSDIAVKLVEASSVKDNTEIKKQIMNRLSDISLLSYKVASSPFAPPINKTQLVCENTFKFAYHGQHNKKNDGIIYKVNNVSSFWIDPGKILTFKADNKELEILYLEYSKEKESPIIHYECKSLE